MLTPFYKTQEEIPEGLREHYVENKEAGGWVLDGFVSKEKLDEFRENNRNLAKEKKALEDQLVQFKDVDPEKYAEAVEKLQALEDKRLAEAGEWKVLKANQERKHADALKAEQKKREDIQAGWNAEKIANATAMTVMKHAMPAKGNMKYIQADIQKEAAIDPETNDIVFFDDKGIKKMNKAGDGPLSLEEYLVESYIPNSALFEKSDGAGSIGGTEVPKVGQGQVSADAVSGKDIPASLIEDLATGKTKAV